MCLTYLSLFRLIPTCVSKECILLDIVGGALCPFIPQFLAKWHQHRLKNSYKLSYDENKQHHRVRRPLIRVWYQEYLQYFRFLTTFLNLIPKMIEILSIYSSTFGQMGISIDGISRPPPLPFN